MPIKNTAIFIIYLLICVSCNPGDSGNFYEEIAGHHISVQDIKSALEKYNDTFLYEIYERNDFAPLWVDDDNKIKFFSQQITSVTEDGLQPDSFWHKENQIKLSLFERLKKDDKVALDLVMTSSYVTVAKALLYGKVNIHNADTGWHAANDTPYTAKDYFNSTGEILSFVDFRPTNYRYKLMSEALLTWKKIAIDTLYQSYLHKTQQNDFSIANEMIALILTHFEIKPDTSDWLAFYNEMNNIKPNTSIDMDNVKALLQRSPNYFINKIRINMERIRWLPREIEPEYIWATIPYTVLDYYNNEVNQFHTKTIVGAISTKTPTIMDTMENIVINPPWTVPYSIVRDEMKGRISSKYKVFGASGRELPRSIVNINNYKRYTIRQPAGPLSALGYLKFNLPNKWHIYLHDTPNRNLFSSQNRFRSHGCVRVQDPRTLATLIFNDPEKYSTYHIDSMISKGHTKMHKTRHIPVYITYLTIYAKDQYSTLTYVNDIYGKDDVLLKLL